MVEFNTQKGAGKVFSIVLLDETKSIQIVFYNEFVDKYYNLVEEGQMYSVSGALVKTAGKFNNTNNTIELNVSSKTEIEKLADDPTISK